MSTRELFGDSSSEDEDEIMNEPKPTATAAAAAADKNNEAEAPSKPTGEGEEETKPQTTNDDDSDDDDDALFDGKGVQGVSSTTMAGTVKGPAPMDVDSDDNEQQQQEEGKQADENDNKNNKPQPDPRTLIVQEFHDGPTPSTQLFMTKLPNLLGIQPRAFVADEHFPEEEQDEFGPQSAFNLVRWRYKESANNANDDDDSQERESNTRLVQWEDGSWTLHVGKEAFEVDLNDSSDPQTSFAGMNGYLYLSQKAAMRRQDDGVQQAAGTALECLGAVHSRLTIRPFSLQSEAHKSLTLAVRQKTIKRARIAEFTTTEDPEKLKEERIRVKQDLEKAAIRKGGGYRPRGSGGGGGGAGRRPRMSRSYLEEEEDDRDFDTTNIRAMKKRMFDRDMDDYGDEFDDDYDDEDESEDETFHRVRPKKKAAGKASKDKDDEEEVFGGDDEDDDDEKVAPVVKANKKRPAQSMFDDDDDSD